MSFCKLHENAQEQIQKAEAKRREEAKRRARKVVIVDDGKISRIVGFSNPFHDALFKLAVMGIRHIEKNGFPKITIKVK